jgi:mannitol-1-/sugar-/sorbitol-6-/2-deoxyglucose-6-phosphatase
MQLNTVIFDMDGLLIDSEPLWNEAADEVFARYGIRLHREQYALTTGLRTPEFVRWWFQKFQVDETHAPKAEADIIQRVIEKVQEKGRVLPGIEHIINFFVDRRFKIGLATSSGQALIEVVIDRLGIREYLHAITSAEKLPYGKPHPQVYLDCAAALGVAPLSCIAFEDSFNGMIAAKAARMKCIVVPAPQHFTEKRWEAADLKLSSLQNFNELLLDRLQH